MPDMVVVAVAADVVSTLIALVEASSDSVASDLTLCKKTKRVIVSPKET